MQFFSFSALRPTVNVNNYCYYAGTRYYYDVITTIDFTYYTRTAADTVFVNRIVLTDHHLRRVGAEHD